MGEKIKTIKTFIDGSFLEYDSGNFDNWCVYVNNGYGRRTPPRDTDYFSELNNFALKYGKEKVYQNYVTVYERTGKQINQEVFTKISEIALTYGNDSVEMDKILSILYMTMIAEENKKNTRLGKRIKRLAIHKLLIEGASVQDAANFMRGMGWKDIDKMCKKRGF